MNSQHPTPTHDWLRRLQSPLRTLHNARYRMGLAMRCLRQEFYRDEPWLRARNRRQVVVNYGPPNIFIEPTNACNLRCPYCPTGTGHQKRELGFIDPEIVRKIVAELHHKPEQFGFWLAGEPLLHPRIVDLVRIAAEAGLRPGMHSNATRLTPELSEALIRAGLAWISFSFDGDNKADYERMRPPARYDETIENLKTFLRIRRELGSASPEVTIQTLIPYQNEEIHPYGVNLEVSEEFRRQFDGYGVDHFRALIVHGWSGDLVGKDGVTPDHCNTGRRWICNVPFRDMTIAWNGDLVTCCGDLSGRNVIDNIRDKTLYEAWNGPGYQRFRRAMLGSAIEKWPLCSQCERIWTVKPHPMDYHLKYEMLRYRMRF